MNWRNSWKLPGKLLIIFLIQSDTKVLQCG
jgi:hypothetical protein